MRAEAPFDRCDQYLAEVCRLLERQLRVMRSLRLYGDEAVDVYSVSEEVLSPMGSLASRHRLEILRAVAEAPRPLPRLSEVTGLRGGNLFFHLNRL